MAKSKGSDVASRLYWARTVSGLSAYALSLRAKLTKTHVSQIEKGDRHPEADTARAICAVLDISWVWLLYGEGPAPTEAQIKKAVAGAA